MLALSVWLTKPINGLTAVTKDMAAGDYARRAKKVSDDEVGVLTENFNHMANALEEKISELREESLAKERFVAAFAHELKTPLTAIIGYADMLRSRKLEEENQFLSADYIFKEGRRLEALSLRLLDMIVLKKSVLTLRSVPVSSVFQMLEDSFRMEENFEITIGYEETTIEIEPALITTVLLNLIDNAVKSYEDGGKIEVSGKVHENGYLFSVKDFGCGIAEEDLTKITQAFYMADKSRARKRNSAGLGLAICAEILELHQSKLSIKSALGEGTTASFLIKSAQDGGDVS
jgi:signal transduction histidine kinase